MHCIRHHLFASALLSLISSPAFANPTPVSVTVPDYQIAFSKLPEQIDILGLRPGMDEETATAMLREQGYRFKYKDSPTHCTYPSTQFTRFEVCIERDDGTRYFVSKNPLEQVFLKFSPKQAGGQLLKITRYVDYGRAKSSSDLPDIEGLQKALRDKYPAPTTGTNFDMTKIQCWAYHDGQPVATFGWGETYCEGNKGRTPVDVRLRFSVSNRLEAILTDFAAEKEAYDKYNAVVDAASKAIIEKSLSERAPTPKL